MGGPAARAPTGRARLRPRRCGAALRHVRAVTATYRMTTRPPPSRPSHYAAGLLAPLRAFLDAPPGRGLPAPARAQLAQARPAPAPGRALVRPAPNAPAPARVSAGARRARPGARAADDASCTRAAHRRQLRRPGPAAPPRGLVGAAAARLRHVRGPLCFRAAAVTTARAWGRQGVAAAVAASFAAAAGDTLDTLRRTESSLRRLKKTRAAEGGAGDAGALSDVDKVGRQLLLDAQARPHPGGLCPAVARRACVTGGRAWFRAAVRGMSAAGLAMETDCGEVPTRLRRRCCAGYPGISMRLGNAARQRKKVMRNALSRP